MQKYVKRAIAAQQFLYEYMKLYNRGVRAVACVPTPPVVQAVLNGLIYQKGIKNIRRRYANSRW